MGSRAELINQDSRGSCSQSHLPPPCPGASWSGRCSSPPWPPSWKQQKTPVIILQFLPIQLQLIFLLIIQLIPFVLQLLPLQLQLPLLLLQLIPLLRQLLLQQQQPWHHQEAGHPQEGSCGRGPSWSNSSRKIR